MSTSSSSSEDNDVSANGKIYKHYRFDTTLGQGSFGKVKLATNLKTKENCAIKIVDKDGIADVEDVERVYRETFILTTLKHDNIIKLFEVFDTPQAIMLVMEFADGGELYNYALEKMRLPEVETCRLFHQIVSGVEYCHRAKIIHRDLKLENILLDKQGNVKIADFGLSNSIKFGQKMDTNCGTPSYTPPEQINGEQYIGSAADMWSLGVILFALICGFLPFEADGIPSLFRKIKNRHYKAPDYITKEAKDLIDKMLQVDPEKRCSIADIRQHPWFLMEYTDLAMTIETRPEVSLEMITKSRNECIAFGEKLDALEKEKENKLKEKTKRYNGTKGRVPGGSGKKTPTSIRNKRDIASKMTRAKKN